MSREGHYLKSEMLAELEWVAIPTYVERSTQLTRSLPLPGSVVGCYQTTLAKLHQYADTAMNCKSKIANLKSELHR